MILLFYKSGDQLIVNKSFSLGKINNSHTTHNINVLKWKQRKCIIKDYILLWHIMFMLNSTAQVNVPTIM